VLFESGLPSIYVFLILHTSVQDIASGKCPSLQFVNTSLIADICDSVGSVSNKKCMSTTCQFMLGPFGPMDFIFIFKCIFLCAWIRACYGLLRHESILSHCERKRYLCVNYRIYN
jgi:hypothetical protein